MNRHDTFAAIARRRYSRREVMRHLALAGTLPWLPAGLAAARPQGGLGFAGIAHTYDQRHHVADGYRAEVLIGWGDPLTGPRSGAWELPTDSAAQRARFGYNNDFLAFLPLPAGSSNSEHGLLIVNHEYVTAHLMFAGYATHNEAASRLTREQMRIEQAAMGLSVVEIRRRGERWSVVGDSTLARRITAQTECRLTGPAAGHARLRTTADRSGRSVLGTLGNCSGGVTPWGTILSGEENIQHYFSGRLDRAAANAPGERRNWESLDVKDESVLATDDDDLNGVGWHRHESRFNLEREPLEFNRFGWLVELDPYDPSFVPRKRTALGRFMHEGAGVVARPGERVVVYSGDDKKHQCIYRFVSRRRYDPDDRAACLTLLDEGDLYAARFSDDGTGRWLRLTGRGAADLAAAGFDSDAEMLIEPRVMAARVGATPMDRPEDIDVSPISGRVYVALTKNKSRQPGGVDAANPRAANRWGQILEITPPGDAAGRDHAADTFRWDLLLLAGDPEHPEPSQRGRYGGDASGSGWFCNPDNLAFDPAGNLWVATDGFPDAGPHTSLGRPVHDGLWAMAAGGPDRATPRHFFGCPRGAELCGPCFTPDGETLFVAVQHPADEPGSRFASPSTRWPDFNQERPPRPAVVAVTKRGGGLIGS